jgi:MOSC domain-containing protein YiiM
MDTYAPMKLISLNRSRAQALMTPVGVVQSAIRKRPVDGPVEVRPLGLEGDEQADLTVHGGLSKAVYAYPSEHYPFWATVRSQANLAGWDEGLPHGAMGENLTLQGLLETQVWLGDRLCFAGGVELVVSEPRQPCFKFNATMGFKQAAKLMVQSGYCGWYLAVKQEGALASGEVFELLPGPREISVPELFRLAMRRQAA